MPDGKRLLITASEPGLGPRLYLRELEGGKPRPLTPEGYRGAQVVSADGSQAVVSGPDRRSYLYPISGGEPTPIPGIDTSDRVVAFSPDGHSLYVHRRGEIPIRLSRVDVATVHRAAVDG